MLWTSFKAHYSGTLNIFYDITIIIYTFNSFILSVFDIFHKKQKFWKMRIISKQKTTCFCLDFRTGFSDKEISKPKLALVNQNSCILYRLVVNQYCCEMACVALQMFTNMIDKFHTQHNNTVITLPSSNFVF